MRLPAVAADRYNGHMRSKWPIILALVLIVFAIYGQVRHHDFVDIDDRAYVVHNPHVHGGLTVKNVVWAFHGESIEQAGNWHPLTWLSLMTDAQIFGMNPTGFHLSNVVLHTITVLLLFAVLTELTDDRWKSAFVAAVFAAHPLHVESVAWISERKDVLSTMFGVLAIWGYVRYARRRERKWYFLSLCAFAASLLSKQMLVTLPFLLLLLDYWPLNRVKGSILRGGRHGELAQSTSENSASGPRIPSSVLDSWRSLVLEKAAFFLLTALFCVAAVWGQQNNEGINSLEEFPLTTRLLNAVVVYATYLGKTIWPIDLAVYYPYPKHNLVAEAVIAGMVLTFLSVVVFRFRSQRPYLLVGWLWYLGTLVPVIGIVQIGRQQMADRYTYFPMIGLLIGITWLVASLMPNGYLRKFVLPGIAASVMVACVATARVQTSYWKDTISLFTHTLRCTENNSLAHSAMGNGLCSQGRYAEATGHYRRALILEPDDADVHCNLGIAFAAQGFYTPAIGHFRRALKLEPEVARAHINLGSALYAQGHFADAVTHYRQAIRIWPELAVAHFNLGNALSAQKHFAEAIGRYRHALILDPDYIEAHNNLGNALSAQRRFAEAIVHFRRILVIDPGNPKAKANLSDAQERLRHE
jgi:Tfp pilus assembly protein PilF